ncbi:hypothetical protein Efla_001202 [Eimeria flavescens]
MQTRALRGSCIAASEKSRARISSFRAACGPFRQTCRQDAEELQKPQQDGSQSQAPFREGGRRSCGSDGGLKEVLRGSGVLLHATHCTLDTASSEYSEACGGRQERLDQELRLLGEYGLKNKREVWRVQYALAKIRSAARELLTLEEKDPRRIFQGTALLRRMVRLGLLSEGEQKLDYVLGLTVQKFLERRLQTRVFKLGLAKSIHHARCLIRQRHIRVGKQIVDIPSFMVRVDSEKHIEFSFTSPYGGGRPGRVKRKALRGGDSKDEDDE